MKLSIVIPCYNEADNIPLILKRFNEVIKREDIEVVLVNNGSTDETREVLKRELPKYSFARTVLVEVNQGYGYGILQGLKSCKSEFIGWTHADMQTDPADVIKALKRIDRYQQEKKDCNIYVKGNRKGRALSDCFFTFGMSCFESIYLGTRLYDINAQPNIFSEKFFDTWKNPPYDFALDLYALYIAKKNKLQIERFDVLFPKRIYGNSKWNTGLKSKIKFIKRTINFSTKLKREGIL